MSGQVALHQERRKQAEGRPIIISRVIKHFFFHGHALLQIHFTTFNAEGVQPFPFALAASHPAVLLHPLLHFGQRFLGRLKGKETRVNIIQNSYEPKNPNSHPRHVNVGGPFGPVNVILGGRLGNSSSGNPVRITRTNGPVEEN